ncbi:hypothetical protein [Pseudostreptobacillus hongkongensis]|nr:hypothetical protein [Pseudostreptobacillus hongkongensis]
MTTGITVNNKFVRNYEKSSEIFLDQKYKGRMAILDDGREVL